MEEKAKRNPGLWQHPDFMKLWVGETISLLGSQITLLALPLTAESILKANSVEMGALTAVEMLPFLLFGLLAGVWVDRRRRRSILIAGDFGRFILLAWIPLAYIMHILALWQLLLIAFLVGVLTLFFDVAYQSYLPSLVSRENLVEGNSKLEISRAMAQIVGPGMAGILIKVFTAPLTIILDSVSFLVSALFLWRIKTQEPEPAKPEAQRHIVADIREGLNVVFGNPILRSIAGCTSTANLFGSIQVAVIILYLRRQLELDEATIGLIFAVGSLGGLAGAVLSGRAAKWLGLGRALIVSAMSFGIAFLMIPLAIDKSVLSIGILILSQVIGSIANVVYNVNQVSLRQTITPDRLQGRMNASMRFLVWGTMPIGAMIGGLLGQANILGLRGTLWVGGIGGLTAFLWLLLSPVRSLKQQPQPVAESSVES